MLRAVTLCLSLLATPPATEQVPSEALQKAPEKAEDQDVTEQWWFWTTVGGAVALGALSFVLLSSGSKGGPSVESPTGSIEGTY